MPFFEFLSDSALRGKCETNHFHIVVDDDINVQNISSLPQKTLGTFMHEYLHYIQFNDSLFGISYGMIFNNYYATCRQFVSENVVLEIPLKIQQSDPIIRANVEKYKKLKGTVRDFGINIDRIEISPSAIEEAKRNKTGVFVKGYDSEGKSVDFEFGYLCIVEGMAHQFQTFFDPAVEHPDIPYNVVEIICTSNYLDLLIDAKMLFSICLCSLIYTNPSTGFFEVLEIMRHNPQFNGRDLYQFMIKESTVTSDGVKATIEDIFIDMITNYEGNIKATIQAELNYYSKVFKNCIREIKSGESLLLNLLYLSDISSKKSVDEILNFYGLPFIEFNNLTLMPGKQRNKSSFLDLARLIGFELVIKRFIPKIDLGKYPKYDPKCPMYPKCYNTLYKEGIEDHKRAQMSAECDNKQWQKQEICLMTVALKWCNIHGKVVYQNELPKKYQ